MINMVRIVPRKLKRAWRKTTARRVLRGLFGPGKKTLERSNAKSFSKLIDPSISDADVYTRLLKMQRPNIRLAVKYSLDALNIKDSQKRKRVFEIFEMYEKKSLRAREFGKNLQPVSWEAIKLELIHALGSTMYIAYMGLFKWKVSKIRKKNTAFIADSIRG